MKKLALFFLLFACCFFCVVQAQEQEVKDLHAAMLYNFVKYIQWPTEAENGDFVIGVLGQQDVYNTLKARYEGRLKGSKKYVIVKLNDPAEAVNCAVVYLGKSKTREFEALKAICDGKSILTITDSGNLGKKGSCVNFKEVDGKLKFEINQESITAASLKVSSSLLSVAIVL